MNHNRLRAGIMGLIDGVASLLLVVAGGLGIREALIVLLAGALSMGIAEYASVANQREALLRDGIRVDTAVRREYNPWDAGITSMVSFALGGLLVMLPLFPAGNHWDTFSYWIAGITLAWAGYATAEWTGSNPRHGAVRLLVAAGLAFGVCYGIGIWIGASS